MERVVDEEGGTLGWRKRKHGAKSDVEERHARGLSDGGTRTAAKGFQERQKWTHGG